MTETTIIVSGAGAVGLALAALLSTGPASGRLRVHVVDPRPGSRWDPDRTDLRVYALSRSSERVLGRIGVWDEIAASRASAYERMHVWEGDDPAGAAVRFDCAEIGEPNLGHIVEDRLIKERLMRRVAAAPNVDVLSAELTAVSLGASGVVVSLAAGARLRGQLLVAADGTESTVRGLLGLPALRASYAQQAIVAHVDTERPHERTARQRFLSGGPLAFLPLADGRSSIVWSLPESRADALMAAGDAEFLAALQPASAGVLGRLGPISERARFPLHVVLALRYCCSRAALVGDAAHTVHPLAGQGMNLGLADAACLAAEIEGALAEGRDPGDLTVLRRYERRRKGENLKMLAALDGLNRLFRLPAWAAPLRGAGLRAVDRAAPAKRLLMREALGLDARILRSAPHPEA
ncbi:MAG TPA: UbiH/UbiF/VisC/COQ6 family ubiquinone biosynthesis hydroxylase [Gammaproteobacteria bacterium]|nr:UbiH/UbiF/VisC/COQ6 family ubiquinone biosynthesis hydroxylase [Gammaproteobacteria bacterium]